MASKFFRKALAEVKPETKIFVKKYLDLLERIHELMAEKKMSQKDLAEALEQQPSAVSRILNSEENYMNFRTIAKLEAIFGQDILVVKGREQAHHFTFEMEKKKQIVSARVVQMGSRQTKTMNRPSFKIGTILREEQQTAKAI